MRKLIIDNYEITTPLLEIVYAIKSQLTNGKLHSIINKGDNIGVENATAQDIRDAMAKARPIQVEATQEFTKIELLNHGFIGGKESKDRREELGRILGIGYSNSKQLLNRLNNFGITREEFDEAVERIEKNER